MNLKNILTLSAFALTAVSLTACELPANLTGGAGTLPAGTPVPNTGSYPTCVSSDTTHTCIGVKVVSYENSSGSTDITETQAINIVSKMNTVWSQCNIAFQLEVYQSVNPTTLGLPYSPNWETQTTAVREAFGDSTRFLVVDVGPWSGATVAVTTMPGSEIYGSIIALSYADNYLTTAHEIAHYEGLYDESGDSSNLLSEVYSPNETGLTASQCATAVSTNTQYWQKMLRTP